jgi:hypothetical protein
VVVEAYVKGFHAQGRRPGAGGRIDGIPSGVSRICKVLDQEVPAFLDRPIENPYL